MRNRLLAIGFVISSGMTGIGCMGCTTIGPGMAGIIVSNIGSNRGVEAYPAKTGFVTYNPITENVLEWPVFQQNIAWSQNPREGSAANEEITFNTKDKMQVSADVSMGYVLAFNCVPKFYVQFRTDDMKSWQDGFMHNLARQHFDEIAGKYDVEQIMGDNAPFLSEVNKSITSDLQRVIGNADVKTPCITINQFGFLSSPRPPKPVLDAINASASAKQTAITVQNQVAQTTAEMQKETIKANTYAANTLIKARAEAEANREIAASVTPTLVDYQRTLRWDGKLPTFTGGGAVPLLNLK